MIFKLEPTPSILQGYSLTQLSKWLCPSMSFSWVVVIAVYGIAEIDCVGRISDYCILLSETISCFEHEKHTDRTLSSSLASQPTSTRREQSGELSIRLLSSQNVISYATFGLRLCDRGIISRCSAAQRQSGRANRETSTICSRLPGPS